MKSFFLLCEINMIKSGYLPTTDSKLGNGTLNKFFVARVIEFNVLKVCAVFIGSKKNIHRFDSLIWITFGFGRLVIKMVN